MKALLRRLLAVMLLLLIPLLAWFAVGDPLRANFVLEREKIATYRDDLGRFEAIAARLKVYQSDLRSLKQDPELARAILRADSETLAAADLQQRIKSVVEGQGGSLVSTQVLDTLPAAPFSQIRINMRMLLSVPVLQQVLHEIEKQRPYLIVRQLLISNRNRAGRRKAAQMQLIESLDVRITIGGYWYPGESTVQAGTS